MCLDEESSPAIEMTDALILFISGLTTFTWCIFVVFTAPQMKQNRTFVEVCFFFPHFNVILFQPLSSKMRKKTLVEVSLKIFWFYILHKIASQANSLQGPYLILEQPPPAVSSLSVSTEHILTCQIQRWYEEFSNTTLNIGCAKAVSDSTKKSNKWDRTHFILPKVSYTDSILFKILMCILKWKRPLLLEKWAY